MAAEYIEAAATFLQGATSRGEKKENEAEEFGYGAMILVVEEAKRWVLDVSRPWVPPGELWMELLVVEMETVSLLLFSCFLGGGA